MPVTRRQLVLALVITGFYWAGQLLTGTDSIVSSVLAGAIFFGMLSIFAGGGLRCAIGVLNAVLVGKFLLLGIAVKIILFEAADGTLKAPLFTALVMLLGFLGVFIGTWIQASLAFPRIKFVSHFESNRETLVFSMVLFVLSYFGYFVVTSQGQSWLTGGSRGIFSVMAVFSSWSIIPPMVYLWKTGSKLWMTHPVILSMLAWGTTLGLLSTSKQGAMEPLVFYVLFGFLRYGLWDLRLWSIAVAAVMLFVGIVYPYSQYVRNAGGREGSIGQRSEVITEVLSRMINDQEFRLKLSKTAGPASYFEESALAPFGRLAMVGEADKLISATDQTHSFTGWETIVWGFKLVIPKFLYEDKPRLEAGNYLGHITGDADPSDSLTQFSYGIMANLYNAFSLSGVAIGTPIIFGGFYYFIRFFLGQPELERSAPTSSTLWFTWIIASFHHSIVESSVSGFMQDLYFPFFILILCGLTKGLCLFFPSKIGGHEGLAGEQLWES